MTLILHGLRASIRPGAIQFGLRIGTPGTPEVADDTIADALGVTRAQARRRIEQAERLAMSLRTPDEYEQGQPGTEMATFLAELPDPLE